VDLPHGDPACFNAPDVNFVVNRQHGGAGPRPEGRGPQGKTSPRGREDPPSGSPASTSHPARLHPLGGEWSGGRSLRVPVSPRLAPRPRCFLPDIVPVGSTPDRLLRVSPVCADSALHVMESRGQPGSHRRAQHEVGLQAGPPLYPHSPPQEGYAEAGVVQGDVSPRHPVLGGPDLVR
jgi:hypothetical protein